MAVGSIDEEPFGERAQRALAEVSDLTAAALVGSDPATVRWLCGRWPGVHAGPPPWSAGTHAVVVDGGGAVVCASEEAEAAPLPAGFSLYTYEGLTLEPRLEPDTSAAAALGRALHDAGLGTDAIVAVEGAALPQTLAVGLDRRPTVEAGHALRVARAVKDEAALRALRAASELVSAGQRAFRDSLAPGIREIDVWTRIIAAMEQAAGARVPALADLMFGERCAEVGLPPTRRQLDTGELALCDLVSCRDGWWADSCVTICAGEPSPAMRRLHDSARRALDLGMAAARPGVSAGELDTVVRGAMAETGYDYPHHTGHGIGTSYHEEPRIVPGASMRLEEDMVVALEPGAYTGGLGLRLERAVVVRADGAEPLGEYALELT